MSKENISLNQSSNPGLNVLSGLALEPSHSELLDNNLQNVEKIKDLRSLDLDPLDIKEEKILPQTRELSSTAKMRLHDPEFKLSLEQSIECLCEYISIGCTNAEKAHGKDLIFCLGSTGAGKSTTINYLHGCSMQSIRKSDIEGLKGSGKIIRVLPHSNVTELMPIGHAKSETFMPTVAFDENFIYCDCPGFFDTRGVEVNIANLVNIKNTLQNAKSIKILIIINYHSLKADRGNSIKNLIKIIEHLFGLKKQGMSEVDQKLDVSLNSLLIGVTQIPEGEKEEIKLEEIRDDICQGDVPKFIHILRNKVFVFDPIEEKTAEGSLKLKESLARLQIIEKIKSLPPIIESSIFEMPLDEKSQLKIEEIKSGISNRLTECFTQNKFDSAANYLRSLGYLKVLRHVIIERSYQENIDKVTQYAKNIKLEVRNFLDKFEFKRADSSCSLLKMLSRSFYPDCDFSADIKELENFWQKQYMCKELENIETEIKSMCEEIDRRTIWSINGKPMLKALRKRTIKDLFGIDGIRVFAENLELCLKEATKIGEFLEDFETINRYNKFYCEKFDVLSDRLEKDYAREQLNNANQKITSFFDEIEVKVELSINGLRVLGTLRKQGSNLEKVLDELCKVKEIQTNVETLITILKEIHQLCNFLEEKGRAEDYRKAYMSRLDRLKNRLECEYAREKLEEANLEIVTIFDEIEAKVQLDAYDGSEVLKTLRENENNLEKLLEKLLKFEAIQVNIQALTTILKEIRQFCKILDDEGRIKNYRKIFLDRLDRLKIRLQREKASQIVRSIEQNLKNNEFKEVKEGLILARQLDEMQQGGWIALRGRVELLKSRQVYHFDTGNYDSSKETLDDLRNLQNILFAELKDYDISLDLKVINQENIDKINKFKTEADKEIENAFSLATLKDLEGIARTIDRASTSNIQSYWKSFKTFQDCFDFSDFEKNCAAFIQQIRKYYDNFDAQVSQRRIIKSKILGEEDLTEDLSDNKSELNHLRKDSSLSAATKIQINLIAAFFVQLRAILTLTTIDQFFRESKNIIDDFLNEHKQGAELCSFIGQTLSNLCNLNILGTHASAIIAEHVQFRRISTKLFNDLTALRKADQIFAELELKDSKILQVSFDSYNSLYGQILSDITSLPDLDQVRERIVNDAKSHAQKISQGKTLKQLITKPRGIGKLLASIFGGWSYLDAKDTTRGVFQSDRTTLLQPHPMQVISVLLLLGFGESDGFKNRFIQVKTGEGKSLIAAAAAIVLALMGYVIDIACFSDYLSSRDSKQYKDLFDLFGTKEDIHYSTFEWLINCRMEEIGAVRQLMEQLMEDKIKGGTQIKSAKERILFVDEVDVFFSNRFLGETYIPLMCIKDSNFQSLLFEVWKNKDTYLKDDDKAIHQMISHPLMKKFLETYPNIKKFINSSVKEVLSGLSAVANGDHRYILHPKMEKNNSCFAYEEGIGYEDKTTGRIVFNTYYSYNTAFAYIKEADRLSENIIKNHVCFKLGGPSFSYAELPNSYSIKLGVTGTLECLSESEKEIIKKYNINKMNYIPSLFQKQSIINSMAIEVYAGKIDAEDEKGYFYNIRKEITMIIRHDRAVLVVFETFERLEKFKEYIASHFFGLSTVKCNYLTERTEREQRTLIISEAASRGQITLLTKIFGRGSDFICRDSELRQNGGVHVIQTFFSLDESEEIQIKGRTCRQGDPGSYKMILFLEDLKELVDKPKHADVDAFFEENPLLAPEDQSSRWYVFLKEKRVIYNKGKIEKLVKSIDGAREKHEAAVRFIEWLEKPGNSIYSSPRQIPDQNKTKALDYLIKLNS